MRYLLVAVLIFQLSTSVVLAQIDTSSFLVRVFGGEDTQAPTTPVLTAVTAISSDQIDISWSTAIDNFFVSGYVLYKDGTPLATTTLTTYSDTGLVASTTHSYFVKAFDPSYNYSSSSNTLFATTPNPTLPSPEEEATGNGGGTASRVVLNNLTITPTTNAARVSLQTAHPARFEIRWGRSNSYELGYTVNDSFVRSHTTTLSGLEPGTTYQYEVIGYTPSGSATLLERGQFSTLSEEDFLPPANVAKFTATAKGNDVLLKWDPPLEEYEYVRVVRSHLGFPTYLDDGVVVYEGKQSALTDINALKEYSPAYYSVFVVDAAGNVSSGAVARVYYLNQDSGAGTIPTQPPLHNGGVPGGTPQPAASTSPHVPAGTRMPGLAEIFLQQREREQTFVNDPIILDSEQSFVISIPKSAVSQNLKTIIVSLTDPSDSRQVYSFILRLNKDGTAYVAVLSALLVEGQSRIIVDIYDYESMVVATYQKTIAFKHLEQDLTPVFPDVLIKNTQKFLPSLAIGVVLCALLLLFFKRRRQTP